MRPPVESLDDFLEGAHQRALTRVVRKRLALGRSLTLAFGHGPSAERFVDTLARTFPHERVHLALLEAEPLRVTMAPQTSAPVVREAPGATGEGLVRALLRQDPDALAVPRLDAVEPALLVNALLTGHQLLLGTGAPTLEAALAALCAGAEGLEGVVRESLDVVCALDERGRLRRVWAKEGPGGLVELARVEGGAVVVDPRALAPEAPAPAPAGPALAPALEARPTATRAPRAVFLPVVEAGTGRSLLGAPRALRRRGSTWPACGGCGGPLALIVQLDLAALPAPLTAQGGLAQLFLCAQGGCDVGDERAPGVLAEVLEGEALEVVEAPEALQVPVVEPGAIVGWRRADEEPAPGDLARLGLTDGAGAAAGPMRCDKLGGWPAWEQGLDWPGDDDGAGFELLFQFAEGEVLAGGAQDRWDDEAATMVPGRASTRVLDPNAPRHFPSVLTAEAVAFLFWQPQTRRLAFRWQTG